MRMLTLYMSKVMKKVADGFRNIIVLIRTLTDFHSNNLHIISLWIASLFFVLVGLVSVAVLELLNNLFTDKILHLLDKLP